MTPTAKLEAIKLGDRLPTFEKTFTSVDLFAYGAATWDWARVHYDAEFARSHNFPNAFVDGQHYGAIFAQQLIHWLGPGAFISRMKISYRKLTFIGDAVLGSGTVVDVSRQQGKLILAINHKLHKRNEGSDLVCECSSVVRVPG